MGLDDDELDCVNEDEQDEQLEQVEEVGYDEDVATTTSAAGSKQTSIVTKPTGSKTAGNKTIVLTNTPGKAVSPMVAHNSASATFSPLVMAGALAVVATVFIVAL